MGPKLAPLLTFYTTLVRPHLEYCVQLWSPKPRYGNWKVIMDIENVQRRYTRLIDGIGLRTYGERLNALSLTTLLERRARGDLIETFKIVGGLVSYGSKFFLIYHVVGSLFILLIMVNFHKELLISSPKGL